MNPNSIVPDYSTEADQKAFLGLPEKFRNELYLAHWDQAVAENKVRTTGILAGQSTKPEAKEKTSDIVELDSENYGAPPENSGIAVYKNGMKSPHDSYTEPQAWEDEKGNWFYNFAGAIQLAKALGRTLPNIDQLIAAINANPDNFRQSAGFRLGNFGKFCGRGRFSDFWSSSGGGSNDAQFGCLKQGDSSAGNGWSNRHRGLSVRFIVDKK